MGFGMLYIANDLMFNGVCSKYQWKNGKIQSTRVISRITHSSNSLQNVYNQLVSLCYGSLVRQNLHIYIYG